jgi:hypothetical protein
MNSVEEYARRWIKSEGEEELDILSEWVKGIRNLLKSRINHLMGEKCVLLILLSVGNQN